MATVEAVRKQGVKGASIYEVIRNAKCKILQDVNL